MARSQKKIYEEYGRRIHEIRTNRGMSLKELSAKVGYSESMLFYIERGSRPLNVALLARLADALCVKVVDLLGITGE